MPGVRPISKSKIIFPLSKISFDLLENILSFVIKHEDAQVFEAQVLYVNRTWARAAVTHIWSHIYIIEPTQQHTLLYVLRSSPDQLMFNYRAMIRSVTIYPVSISNMKPGGLLRSLKVLRENLPNLKKLHVEDKLSFCHVCYVGREATTAQIGKLLCVKGLKELKLDSNHWTFNDELLEIMMPAMTGGLNRLSLNGENFTDEGIIEHVIPNLKDDLIEFSAEHRGLNPVSITGRSILAILSDCRNLKRMSLEGIYLHDQDFLFEELPESKLEHLTLGKVSPQDFTTFGFRSLLLTCHKTLISLVLDMDHISQTVLQDIIIPLFQRSQLQELHLVSESWAAWTAHYPRPRYEHELRAKEAMWRWKMKAYWGLSDELIKLVGEEVKTLRVFSILGKNHLNI
ncbi:3873_t:CDS:1 [Ambispora leptoticha]|uniref:3873_t:CDS:1 n=1 Tax=Ambispora leptoticha TaxID=144679 RepID=A0A9N9A6L7_9GLOM|nr:3873_t:CDS:1 [Ambispora leptoticha]